MTRRDEKYRSAEGPVADFDFGEATAAVFDDMLDRSVPLYREIQSMLADLAACFAKPQSRLYDLGCSTGNTLLALESRVPEGVTLVGLDASAAMLEEARAKLGSAPRRNAIEFLHQDLESDLLLNDASVVILNLTLQFVRPLAREQLLTKICEGLRPGGCLLLVEKVVSPDSRLHRLFIDRHYAYKRQNGYSAMEISAKREALENILVPFQSRENETLLRRAGFSAVEPFFRWYNFEGMIALKAASPESP